nr:ribonuclease H-like domain-containing protein [Tanacetum cinerariifolium]
MKKSDSHWTTEAKEASKQMKQLIAELPMLTAPMEKEQLIVYLAETKVTVSAVLMTERKAKQMPIYFVSRALKGPELNYVNGKAEEETLHEPWILFTDGSSCTDGSGTGLIPISENKTSDALSKIASTSFALLSKQVLVEELYRCRIGGSQTTKPLAVGLYRLVWSLESLGEFTVASVRKLIDDKWLPGADNKTRWIKYVPIKINVHAWKVMSDSIPTKLNISRQGISIDSLSCVMCDNRVETSNHLFFSARGYSGVLPEKMHIGKWNVFRSESCLYRCYLLALESKFTPVEESTGVLETTIVEDVVLTGMFPDKGICSVNLIFLSLFFRVTAISLVPKSLMQGQYLDSGCSKHMIGYRSQLINFVQKFLGTVKFRNDHVAKIIGYGDYKIGNVTISSVYFVGQFYDSDLEGLVRGLPKLKFEKDHLCSACAMGKSKKKSHKPKFEDPNQEKLYLLHMDLYGPMSVESVNGKKYILVIVDDYSRFIWVKFLRSKDEALDFIIKFLKMIQVRLKIPVRHIQTDNKTEFVNQTLREFYEEVGIYHETSVTRSSQKNGVIEIRNRTLIESARTIVDHQAPKVIALIADVIPPVQAESTGLPSSTSVDQNAPSPSKSQTTPETPSVIPQDVEEDNHGIEVAHMGNDSLLAYLFQQLLLFNLHQRHLLIQLYNPITKFHNTIANGQRITQ